MRMVLLKNLAVDLLCSPTYGALNVNCGSVMYEPQSLEAPKGFPQGGS